MLYWRQDSELKLKHDVWQIDNGDYVGQIQISGVGPHAIDLGDLSLDDINAMIAELEEMKSEMLAKINQQDNVIHVEPALAYADRR